MRNENGIWCDVPGGNGRICGKPAIHVANCKVEQSEFAFCEGHKKQWNGKTHGKPDQQQRCPRCLPGYLARTGHPDANKVQLPPPITGALARAIEDACHREGILAPTINRVLQRLAATESMYVRSIFASTADPQDGYLEPEQVSL